ncbi:MAG: TIGR04211 family SH3 domain-containing protein [Candidatus Rariloculaceae bacterium]
MIRLAWAMLMLCGATVASAETAYVTDVMLLGLHAAEDTSDQPFQNLVSGTEIEVLERTRDYTFVQTASGQQGWVKSAFLVTKRPARSRVAEVEAALEIMREELERAQAAQQDAESHTEELGRNIQAREDTSEAVLDTLTRLKSEAESYEAQMDAYRGSLPLAWVVAALIVAIAAGFFAGMWCLDTLIRRRHGGFRVY